MGDEKILSLVTLIQIMLETLTKEGFLPAMCSPLPAMEEELLAGMLLYILQLLYVPPRLIFGNYKGNKGINMVKRIGR